MKTKVIILSVILLLVGSITYADISKPTDLITRAEMEQMLKANNPEQRTLDAIEQNINSSVLITSGPNVGGGFLVSKVGSGFYVSDKLIVTAYHILAEGKIHVTLNDGKWSYGKVVRLDIPNDFALIEVDTPGKPVSFADKAKLGETAIAIGSPDELKNTITKGIVSGVDVAVNRRLWTQIDVPVNHGNSGGMLINLNGDVIGMIQTKIDKDKNSGDLVTRIGFAARLDEIKEFLK